MSSCSCITEVTSKSKMNNIYIYHHLGLGDHIICKGIVMHIYNKLKDLNFNINLFSKPHNVPSVMDLYLNLPINIIAADDPDVFNFLKSNPLAKCIRIGFEALNNKDPFDQQFYSLAGVPFKDRITHFNYAISPREEILKDKLINDSNRKFALVHEDTSRGYSIDYSKINLPVIKVEKFQDFSMPNYRSLIMAAEEIHVIDSSLMFLVDYLDLPHNKKLYVHRYARYNPTWQLPTLRQNWNIIDKK